MNEYYGAPNDFRSYIAHRMNEHDDPTIHKARKDANSKNKSSNKQAEMITASEQKSLINDFKTVANKFQQIAYHPQFSQGATISNLSYLKQLYQKCVDIINAVRSENRWLTLQESQTIRNFIDKVNSSISSNSSRPSRWD